jgi:hypothetical protein
MTTAWFEDYSGLLLALEIQVEGRASVAKKISQPLVTQDEYEMNLLWLRFGWDPVLGCGQLTASGKQQSRRGGRND